MAQDVAFLGHILGATPMQKCAKSRKLSIASNAISEGSIRQSNGPEEGSRLISRSAYERGFEGVGEVA